MAKGLIRKRNKQAAVKRKPRNITALYLSYAEEQNQNQKSKA